jgi:tetratricopeptide (TPR) repeat protein
MWVGVVSAQDEEDPELQRAVLLFEESEDAYNEGRFDEAAAMLRRAYSIHPDPLLLFNLARALEGEGDLEGAIENYERYIREAPDAEDRGAIEARVRTLRAQREQLTHEEEGDEEIAEEDLPDEAEEDDGGGGGVNAAPWIVTAGGLAVVAVGGVFGAMSQSRAADADTEPVQVDAKALHDEASTFATLANVFIIAGAVLTVGGVVWGIVDLLGDDEEGEADADIAVVPGGILVYGRF